MQPAYRTAEIIGKLYLSVVIDAFRSSEYYRLEFIIVRCNGRLHILYNSGIIRQFLSGYACHCIQIGGADGDGIPLQSFVHDGYLHLAHLVRLGCGGIFCNESQGISACGNRILGIQSACVLGIEGELIGSRLFIDGIAQPFRIGEAYLYTAFRLCLDNGINGRGGCIALDCQRMGLVVYITGFVADDEVGILFSGTCHFIDDLRFVANLQGDFSHGVFVVALSVG